MSASSREEFKRQRMLHRVSSLDDQDTPMTDTSSSSNSSEIVAPEKTTQQVIRCEKLGTIASLSNEQLGLNIGSRFFSPTPAVLVLQSTFSNLRDQSVLSRLCRAGRAMFQERVKEQTLAKLAAQHLLDGNIAAARAVVEGKPNKIFYCTVEATHRRCHLALMSEDQENRNPRKIYIETNSSQLNYQFIGLNGKTLINGKILWNKWKELPPDFPQDDQKIIGAKDKYLPIILEQISKAGHIFNRGQKVRGTLLQIAVMAGATKANANDDDMVEEWSAPLPPAEATRQRQAVLLGEAERAARMQPYVTAMEVFLSEIITARTTTRVELEIKLVTCIENFKRAFIPDSNVVITSGFIFDSQLFSKACELFEANVVNGLGGWWSDKSDFFDVYGYGTLQACASVWDIQILRKGIKPVIVDGKRPDRTLNFTSGVPSDLSRLGVLVVLDILGAVRGRAGAGGWWCWGDAAWWQDALYSKLCASKNNIVAVCYATARQSCQESEGNPVAFFSNPAAIAAAGESSQQALINHSSNSSYCQTSVVPTHQSAHLRK